MPRKGQGQKVQTATGQQYGQAKEQEQMQRMQPLPEMPKPSLDEKPRMAPGQQPFARPTERPGDIDPYAEVRGPDTTVGLDNTQRMKAMMALAQIEQIASLPDASPHLRNTARRLRRSIGNIKDFSNAKEI